MYETELVQVDDVVQTLLEYQGLVITEVLQPEDQAELVHTGVVSLPWAASPAPWQ